VIAADAISGARAVAPDREISIDVAPDAGPLVVKGDDHRLRQIVGNLMSNALIHTPTGTAIEVRLRAEDAQAVLEVVDHGPGLDAIHSERVFERFYRVDAARSRRVRTLAEPRNSAESRNSADARNPAEVRSSVGAGYPAAPNGHGGDHTGTGLGLAIVAALVAAHGGTVALDTSPGGGATFRIRLSLHQDALDDPHLLAS